MTLPPLAVSPVVAAEALDIGRTKLYELLESGRLPSVHIGRRRLIRVADLAAFVASLEVAE